MKISRLLMMFFCGVCFVLYSGCKKDEPAVADKPKPPPYIPSEPVKKQAPPIREEKPAVEMPLEDEYQAGKLFYRSGSNR